jgi:hypothetical protein
VRFDCSFVSSAAPDSFEICVSPRTYTGLVAGAYVFKVRASDAAGNLGLPVSASFTYDPASAPPPPNTFQDDFSSPDLNPAWTWVDPLGNTGWSLTASPGRLRIAAPAGSAHNCWTGLQTCARMLTRLDPGDFAAETKIDGAALGPRAQGYGIFLWQNAGNYIRFEFWSYGTGVVYAAAWRVINGSGSQALPLTTVTLGASNRLRVTRTGNTYRMFFITDGSSVWRSAGSFTQSNFAPAQVGLDVVNYETTPQTTANFDFFSLAPGN